MHSPSTDVLRLFIASTIKTAFYGFLSLVGIGVGELGQALKAVSLRHQARAALAPFLLKLLLQVLSGTDTARR
jgi:hypothetical protein